MTNFTSATEVTMNNVRDELALGYDKLPTFKIISIRVSKTIARGRNIESNTKLMGRTLK